LKLDPVKVVVVAVAVHEAVLDPDLPVNVGLRRVGARP
jgi:hypothetical protein